MRVVAVRSRTTVAVAGLLLAVAGVVGACADDTTMSDHMGDGGSTYARSAPLSMGPPNGPGMAGHAMTRREADYLTVMVDHHQEAIVAAGELARAGRPELRRLGRTIVRDQTRQVHQMRRWLDRWYAQVPTDSDYQPMMSDLSTLRGDDLDRTFLTEMVHHHMMAVMMSRHLLRSGEVRHSQVAGLASTVVEDQIAEIRLMQRWLRTWQLR